MENVNQFVLDMVSRPPLRALLILLGALVVAKLVDLLLCRALKRLTAKTNTELDERLIDRLHRPIFLTVVLIGAAIAVQTLDMPETADLWILRVIKSIGIVVWMMAGLGICSELLASLSRLSQRVTWIESRTLPLFDNLGRLLIVGLGFYALLVAWNLNLGAWLASAGIAGLAIGFAAKDTLANLFGGLFVIIDSPYKIGDFINLDTGERGRVAKIGLRSTRLLTRDDVEITVPNAAIAAAKIVNESGGPLEHTRVATTVGVAYGSDVDQVREVLLQAAQSVELVLEDPEPRIRFTEMGDSALIFRVLCWIDEPVFRGRCLDGLNTAIYKALNREKISIPFPQRDVHLFRAGDDLT